MKLLRVMFIEIKKSISSNVVLSIILFFSIIISFSVFIMYNDSFFNDERKYMSSHLKMHSVEVEFPDSISVPDVNSILERLDSSFCDYVLLSSEVSTKDETYSISSVSTLLPIAKNPYKYLYSLSNQKKLLSEPSEGAAYITNSLTTSQKGEGLYNGGALTINNNTYTIRDICVLNDKHIQVFLPYAEFEKYDKIDSMIYSYKENASLFKIRNTNAYITSLHPDAEITVRNEISESSQSAYNQTLTTVAILLIACVLNYCLIFTYLAAKRYEDYLLMRLFGLRRSRILIMLVLELLIYNIAAYIVSIVGFCIYWVIQNDADIIVHMYNCIPIIGLFLGGSAIIGIYYAAKISLNMPIAYKTNR